VFCFFQAEDGIRDDLVTGVQTCALPILNPSSEGQKIAQRDIATALETALDARRQRIIISESQVNLLKWACLFIQAVCALVAIARSEERRVGKECRCGWV